MSLASEPPRRTQRNKHLDASIVPVERALLERAEFLSARASQRNSINEAFIIENGPDIESALDVRVAEEFRALADELHYWG